MIFVNKMDKIGADFYRCVEMIGSRLGATPLVMQLPIGAENEFAGCVDLIEMKALVWKSENLGAEWDIVDIPADLQAKAEEYREKMIETAVEVDEAAMEAYLEGEMPDNDKLRALIRKGTCNVDFFPVFCGSAFKNKGVQPLLDAVVDFLPSPTEVPAIRGIDPKTEEESAHFLRRRAAVDAGLQDHERPVRRFADLLPHLFGQGRNRRVADEHGQGKARAYRPHAADALQQPRRHQGSLCG
jgi:elongation factor G